MHNRVSRWTGGMWNQEGNRGGSPGCEKIKKKKFCLLAPPRLAFDLLANRDMFGNVVALEVMGYALLCNRKQKRSPVARDQL